MRYAVACAVFLAGCATVPPAPVTEPASVVAPAPVPGPVPGPAAGTQNVAVAGLMETARADASAGRHANAAATLERALRIEPRNARLWHELARVRLTQGEYEQAESIAARSNTWAGSDGALRGDNWRLIAEARAARGDTAGSRSALERAARVPR